MPDVMVCPVCNSQDIRKKHEFKFERWAGLDKYRCNNCGYYGPMTLMEKEGADKLKVLKPKTKSKGNKKK